MGYGSRALELLQKYYQGEIPCEKTEQEFKKQFSAKAVEVLFLKIIFTIFKNFKDAETLSLLDEQIAPRANLPPLLMRLNERPSEKLDYLGVSFGLTLNLLKFWKKAGYMPVYLRQTTNELTGEHTCIMLKMIGEAGKFFKIGHFRKFSNERNGNRR